MRCAPRGQTRSLAPASGHGPVLWIRCAWMHGPTHVRLLYGSSSTDAAMAAGLSSTPNRTIHHKRQRLPRPLPTCQRPFVSRRLVSPPRLRPRWRKTLAIYTTSSPAAPVSLLRASSTLSLTLLSTISSAHLRSTTGCPCFLLPPNGLPSRPPHPLTHPHTPALKAAPAPTCPSRTVKMMLVPPAEACRALWPACPAQPC